MNERPAGAPMPVWLWPWCAFLFLVPFESLLNVAGLATPLLHLPGLAAALLIALARPGRAGTVMNLAVAFLVVALAASYFNSIHPASTRSALILVGASWLTYVLASSAALDARQQIAAFRSWLWGGIAASLVAILAYLQGKTDPDGRLTLIVGPWESDPNFFVGGLIFPFVAAMYFLGRKGHRPEGALGFGAIVVVAVLAQSRGSLLALLVAFLAMLVASKRPKTLLVTCALVPALYFAFLPSLGRFDLTQDATGSGRTAIWRVGIEAGLANPVTGTGLATYPRLTRSASGLNWERDSHSLYVQAFTEAGLPGLLCLLFVFLAHGSARRKPPLDIPVVAGLVGVAAAGVFLHLLTFKLLWVAWIAAAQAAQEGQAEDPIRGVGARLPDQRQRGRGAYLF